LFAAALYHWQRDLAVFLQKLGVSRLSNTQQLALTMMRQRKNYIHAATLFGDVHRFTLLRAILAIDQSLYARGLLNQPLDKPVRRAESAVNPAPMRPNRVTQCWQREMLLRIHVDTAVKIAYVGSATGWMLETDRLRGTPQLFMMQFESIHSATARLQRML
jgi:hypothetical protein